MTKRKTLIKRCIWAVLVLFLMMNVVAIFHSYKFTHFSADNIVKTKTPKRLSTGQKIKALIMGVSIPRPVNKTFPEADFKVLNLKSNKTIECWSIEVTNSTGTVILFHGYSGEKSTLLEQSHIFNELGYSTFLVDFMGSGGSEGNQTTIGFLEAEQVKTAFQHLEEKGIESIYLYGVSMGAVAIMKSIDDYDLKPKAIILECPFGTMSQTVSARFRNMGVPTFPMADLLAFWGGVQNGFWAFGHNPIEYARNISCPTLLLFGAKDDKVSRSEINGIFKNLTGKKELHIYENSGHENYLEKYKSEWREDINGFLNMK